MWVILGRAIMKKKNLHYYYLLSLIVGCSTACASDDICLGDTSASTSNDTKTEQQAPDRSKDECCCKYHSRHKHHHGLHRKDYWHQRFDPFFDFGRDIFAETMEALERARAGMDAIMQEQQSDESQKSIAVEIKDEDPTVFKIIIAFADPTAFNEKDIAVTITTNEIDETKILKVTAKKTSEEKKSNGKNKDETSEFHSSSSYSSYSQTSINGKVNRQASTASYVDGVFIWSVALPADVVTDGEYKMSFNEGKLVITLDRKNTAQQVRTLSFSPKKSEKK